MIFSKSIIQLTIALLTTAMLSGSTYGDLVQLFRTDDDGTLGTDYTISADTYTRTLTGLVADGVTFSATVTLKGFDDAILPTAPAASDLTLASTGVGVAGNSSDLVSNGERLGFTMSIFGATGGTVAFNGFTAIDYNSFGATDSGVLSLDIQESTLPDNFFTTTTGATEVDISGTVQTSFFAIATDGALNSFRVDDVTGSFTGTAVPEPTSLALFGALVPGLLYRRKRKA